MITTETAESAFNTGSLTLASLVPALYVTSRFSAPIFADAGFYKFHEAYHLLKFNDERQILKKAYYEYSEMRKNKEFLRKKFGESKL